MSLLKLPPNVLQCIVDELKQARHISSLARANKQLYNALYPYLCQQGISAVNRAARKGNSHVIKSFLLRYEANVNVTDEDGRTPIFNAIDSRDEVIVKTLLQQKSIDLVCRDRHGHTPLSYAASKDFLFAVRMLLDKGVNVNVGNCCMYTPLNWAVQHKNIDMVDTLLESLRIAPAPLDFEYGRIHYSNSLSLNLAAATGDIEIIQRLLNYGYDVNTRDNRGRTPLHRAVEKGHLPVVNMFLAQPDIDINRADGCGRTPMWVATRYGRDDVARRLLALPDLNVNAAVTEVTANAGEETSTSLHHVVRRGSPSIAGLLVATKQLDPNVTDDLGRTPLHWAANNRDLAMVNLLLDRLDVVVASKDTKGSTPLKMAIQQGHFGVAHRLLQHPSYRQVTAFPRLSRL